MHVFPDLLIERRGEQQIGEREKQHSAQYEDAGVPNYQPEAGSSAEAVKFL
jgi:hypothetical protein